MRIGVAFVFVFVSCLYWFGQRLRCASVSVLCLYWFRICIFPVGSGGGGGDVDDGDGDLAAGDGVDGGGCGGGGGGGDGDGDGGAGDDDGDDAGDDGDDDGASGVSLFGAFLWSVSMMETEVDMVGLASAASWLAQVG